MIYKHVILFLILKILIYNESMLNTGFLIVMYPALHHEEALKTFEIGEAAQNILIIFKNKNKQLIPESKKKRKRTNNKFH